MKLRAIVLAFSLLPLCATAQDTLSPGARDTALQAVRKAFDERYVFPEMRPKIAARLDEQRRAGRYDVDDPALFADRISEDLKDVAHDRHLWMRKDPAGYAAALAEGQGESAEQQVYWRNLAVRGHHGLAETKILPGNVRYLRISGFHWVDDLSGTYYDAAARFLADGDAIIIDLRNNGGGSHGAVRYLVSHFLEPNTLELTFHETGAAPKQTLTLDHLPAGRIRNKPLYVLTNRQTASAAEAFTYDVQQFKLGELVGEKTAGAANNNAMVPVPPYYVLSVSFGRPEHAVSHTNWEGEGIAPDVDAPSAQALDVAHERALGKLAANPQATDEQRREYAWAVTGVEARLHPAVVSPKRLAGFAGTYARAEPGSQPARIAWRDGALWLTLGRRPEARLSPLTSDVYTVDGYDDALRVRLAGRTLDVLWHDEAAPRVYQRR